jgi:DNA-binding beta-propeller fold protein YncE
LRVYKNPDGRFDEPHGILVTDKHIIVSNIHGHARPSTLTVYRIGEPSDKPVSVYETPFQRLREGHSLAINGNALVVTYCINQIIDENEGRTGAIVSYRFDDESGVILGVIDICESCFKKYGDSKGVSFNSDGSKIYVTFNTERPVPKSIPSAQLFKRTKGVLEKRGIRECVSKFLEYVWRSFVKYQWSKPSIKNGILIIEINENGTFSREPVKILLREKYCRLENINFVGTHVVITDMINNMVYLHDVENDPELNNPIQIITEHMTLPHGAKLSPDKKYLVVTNYGLNVINKAIQWGSYTSPRKDRVFVYELH